MRRPVLSTFLLLGAVFGFTAGFHHHHRHREAFYHRVAEVCVDAARRHDRHPPPATHPRDPHRR
jgi:hypothetical protein